jgi:hypothetical protein
MRTLKKHQGLERKSETIQSSSLKIYTTLEHDRPLGKTHGWLAGGGGGGVMVATLGFFWNPF